MSVATIVRRPYLRVTVNGIELRDRFEASCSFGFDQQTATASITLPIRGTHTPIWGLVEIVMGATQQTARPRFRGYVTGVSYALWPRAVSLECQGFLVLAELYKNTSPDGTSLAGQTDEAQINAVLATCGIGNRDIRGTGTPIGTVAVDEARWDSDASGLSYIQSLDEISLGYRTFDTLGGAVVRRRIHARPLPNALFTFTEGVDIFSGSQTSDPTETRNRVMVTGFQQEGLGTPFAYAQQASNWLPPNVSVSTEEFSSNLIERASENDAGSGITAQSVARWKLHVLNRLKQTVTFDTPRDELIHPGTTISVESQSRLGVIATYWVQNVTVSISASGEFTQTLTVIGGPVSSANVEVGSGWIPEDEDEETDLDEDEHPEHEGEGAPDDPENPEDQDEFGPLVDFIFRIEQETILVDGATEDLFVVYAEDVSMPGMEEIWTREWSLPGGVPEEAEGEFFTGRLMDLSDAELTLTVTDFNDVSDSLTVSLDVDDAEIMRRVMYAAAETVAEAFDSEQWREQEPENNQPVSEVAHGPYWIAGNLVYRSQDFLITDMEYSEPFPGAMPTAIWAELDADENLIMVGANNGQIAISNDAGETWDVRDGPSSDPVLRCVISRFSPNHQYVMTDSGFYETHDGSSWSQLQAAEEGESFVDLNVSFERVMVAMIGGRGLIDGYSGTPQGFVTNGEPDA